MQMRRDIRIQKARARWQRVNQSINAGYSRSNTSSLCSLASSRERADHTCPADVSGIPQKPTELSPLNLLRKWASIVIETARRKVIYSFVLDLKFMRHPCSYCSDLLPVVGAIKVFRCTRHIPLGINIILIPIELPGAA